MRLRLTGLAAWLVQRASAIYMLLFAVFALVSLSLDPVGSYAEWKAWMARPSTAIATFLFFAALLTHMWVGLRDVLLDYARPAGVRRAALVLLAVGLVAIAAWLLGSLIWLQR